MPLAHEWAVTFGRLAANHLWQSTGFAAVAVVLALALRANSARARYGLWMAASVKFLVPFSVLAAIGGRLGQWLIPATPASRAPLAIEAVVQSFAPFQAAGLPTAFSVPAPSAAGLLPAVLLAIWFCGCVAVLLCWWVRWRRVAAAVRSSTPLTEGREVEALWRLRWGRRSFSVVCQQGSSKALTGHKKRWPVPLWDLLAPQSITLVSSTARLEPGVFGIFRPVLWLPVGIADRLDRAELEAILAHELCHVRRRDNLAAAVHMVVEAIFWFHPLVWWLGARLTEERERACDEEVVRMGGEAQVYAESILKVCEFYLASPVACAAGVTGGELKMRIEGIMANRFTRELTLGKKTLLTATALVAIGAPVGIGVMTAQPSHAQSHGELAAAAGAAPAFEVASVKPSSPRAVGVRMRRDPGLVNFGNVALIDILAEAYNVDNQLISGSSWLIHARYDIVAKVPKGVSASQVPAMFQALLLERFKMKVHRETKVTEVYALAVGKGGPKLERAEDEPAADLNDRDVVVTFGKASSSPSRPAGGFQLLDNLHHNDLGFKAVGVTMAKVVAFLKGHVQGLPVVDCTGLQGRYNFTFKFDAGPEGREPPWYNPPALFTAIERLGLKLEARRVPVDRLVVDHVERPTEN